MSGATPLKRNDFVLLMTCNSNSFEPQCCVSRTAFTAFRVSRSFGVSFNLRPNGQALTSPSRVIPGGQLGESSVVNRLIVNSRLLRLNRSRKLSFIDPFSRTLKEQAVYGRVFRNLADVRAAVGEFVECWRLEKLACRTPREAREEYELRHAA